ncbi:MAG: efflux RND transporter periplasmic adaptor subunit [Rhodanobacteraceae bacterium]
MSRWKIALIIVAVLVVALLGYRLLGGQGGSKSGPGGAAPGADNKPVPVTVVPVEQKSVPIYLFAQGTVQARNTVNVRPQVGGLLLSLNFEEGKEVEEGQVLAQIDPRSYQAQYDQALARQKQDSAQLATARSNLKRSNDLIKQSYISKQDLTTIENTVNQYAATVAADAATARDAKLKLDYTKVRAPFSGLAGLRQVDPGNVVSTSDSIVVLTQVHPINLLFTLPAKNLEQVRTAQAKGDLPVAALDGADNHVLADDGRLIVIDNQIDTGSGTVRLKAEFPNEDKSLWPGQFANVRLRVGNVDNGLVIPSQAVQRGPDGEYVYLLGNDDTVSMQPITTGGEADDAHTLISKGLKAGDKVVTEGMFRLKPGSKVKPLKPGEIPAAPTKAEIDKAAKTSGRGGRRH